MLVLNQDFSGLCSCILAAAGHASDIAGLRQQLAVLEQSLHETRMRVAQQENVAKKASGSWSARERLQDREHLEVQLSCTERENASLRMREKALTSELTDLLSRLSVAEEETAAQGRQVRSKRTLYCVNAF